jgi:hypothetical protein
MQGPATSNEESQLFAGKAGISTHMLMMNKTKKCLVRFFVFNGFVPTLFGYARKRSDGFAAERKDWAP